MKRDFLITIGIILVAIIGFGCVSAADASNNTISDHPTVTIEQQNANAIQEQNEIINTEKEVKTENSNVENSTQTITQENDTNNINNNSNTIIKNNNNSIKTEAQIEDDEEIQPGNGFTVDEIKQIRKYEEYYKEHNYDLRELIIKISKDRMSTKDDASQDIMHTMKTITVIHNEAIARRGYGKFYTVQEVFQMYLYYAVTNIIDTLAK